MNPTSPTIESLDSLRGVRFARVDYPSAHRMPTHVHESSATLDYCVSGTICETRDRSESLQGPASLSYMPVGVPHATGFSQGTSTFLVQLGAVWVAQFRAALPLLDVPMRCQ